MSHFRRESFLFKKLVSYLLIGFFLSGCQKVPSDVEIPVFDHSSSEVKASHHFFEYGAQEKEIIDLQKEYNHITQKIKGWVRWGEIVGAEWLMIKGRKVIIHASIGWKDFEEEAPLTPNTIFRIRSMTKPFIGTAILMLADKKKLEINDPVSKYIKNFQNPKTEKINIYHLLTHTSGFEDGLPFPGRFQSLKASIDTIGKIGPQNPVNTSYIYSDINSGILGQIISVVSGQLPEDFIREKIIVPLKLENTFSDTLTMHQKRADISSAYMKIPITKENHKYWDNDSTLEYKYFRCSGGLFSTPIDYARFLKMWSDNGKTDSLYILSPESIQKALEPTPLSIKSEKLNSYGYGMQMQILTKPINGQKPVFGHSGSDGTVAFVIPEKDLIICYFTQTRGNQTMQKFYNEIKSLIE
ncbi:serine hydrolase domain-containing protein [Flexithrix dorotheae]|uniref:serine hydrolase domain-containing protein n=1 Tax=Flexithrix dorotheae TaxID=70993 RepID=UPI000373DF6C|nr:serine hydrolase domain-containing protein [Flexithrix dorotheae]